jgi:hypothetical protein
MAAGFRDLLAFLLGWQSAHKSWQTEGPYRTAASDVFVSTPTAGGVFHAGTAAATVSAGNVTAGHCYG